MWRSKQGDTEARKSKSQKEVADGHSRMLFGDGEGPSSGGLQGEEMSPICSREGHLLTNSALDSLSLLSFVPQLPLSSILLLLVCHRVS